MKKIFVAFALLYLSFSPFTHCHAADWYWLTSNDKVSYYVDRECGRWERMDLYTLIKRIESNGNYDIVNLVVQYKSGKEIYLKENSVFSYTADGRCIYTGPGLERYRVKPNTTGQTVAYKLFDLYKGHFKNDNHIPE